MKKRLSKALAAAGVASRRGAEEMIFDGRVSVNGQVVLVPQTLVEWGKDRIALDDNALNGEEPKVYYILNKPKGYVCTAAHIKGRRVLDLFDKADGRLFTVGRLDRDTGGLLIVTNDGHFANRIIHPSSNIEKEYLVKVDREIGHDHLVTISRGLYIDGCFVKPIAVKKIRKGTLKVILSDGKKREVRQLVENSGLEVHELTRIRIGGLVLGELPTGYFRPMTERDKTVIFHDSKATKTRAST